MLTMYKQACSTPNVWKVKSKLNHTDDTGKAVLTLSTQSLLFFLSNIIWSGDGALYLLKYLVSNLV